MAAKQNEVSVENERETGHGWAFDVRIADDLPREVRLSWADYEYWSHGTMPPARIVEVVMAAWKELGQGRELPRRVDLSTVRRMIGGQGLDEYLRERM